jgi:hypothetical protein
LDSKRKHPQGNFEKPNCTAGAEMLKQADKAKTERNMPEELNDTSSGKVKPEYRTDYPKEFTVVSYSKR